MCRDMIGSQGIINIAASTLIAGTSYHMEWWLWFYIFRVLPEGCVPIWWLSFINNENQAMLKFPSMRQPLFPSARRHVILRFPCMNAGHQWSGHIIQYIVMEKLGQSCFPAGWVPWTWIMSDVFKSSTLNIYGYTYGFAVCYICRALFLFLKHIALRFLSDSKQ
jgi:hypothetical protein